MIFVSIVGDFYSSILPLFYEYKDKMTKHIIIYDDFKNDIVHAKKIIAGTTKFIEKNALGIESISMKIDEDSIQGIQSVIKTIEEHTRDDEELYINITDGLANIGVLLCNAFLHKGAKMLSYDRYDNEYNLLSKESMHTLKMKTSIPIKDHLALKDIDIVQVQDISFAKKYRKDLNLFFEKYEGDKELYKKSAEADKALNKIQTGFLYEYYIYNLIKKLAFDDILLGVKIKDNRLNGIYLENEYDILIMKNNHLHMIECKYLKILETATLLYKLDSVRESLDEDANIMIVTDFNTYDETADTPNELLNQNYKRAFAKRVHLRGSPSNSAATFIRDVDTVFSLKTPNIDAICAKKTTYVSIKKVQRKKMKREINEFLNKKLKMNTDFFDKNVLLRLFNYKTYKKTTPQVKQAMQSQKFHEFIKLINTMLSSKAEYVSIYDVHNHYTLHFKTN